MHSSAPDAGPVVAIGASAGGLEALRELLARLPAGARAAFVIAQHQAPDHTSQLAELLGRVTPLPVQVAQDPTPLQPGQIVVIPPNRDATVANGQLRLSDPLPRFGPSPSIDRLFESLAQDCGERSLAVVLSGTGSDGACGLRVVGAAGGITLVQSPASARFDGMPRAALSLGSADLVADPAELGDQLAAWLGQGQIRPLENNLSHAPLLLSSAAAQLQQCTGIDFSQYKESSLRRQLQRRMAIRGLSQLEDYLPLLAAEPAEAQALAQNLLVNVTAFFRDPEAFTALAKHLQPLLDRRRGSDKLRVWVPGCATGEEAYTLAMILSEALHHPADLGQQLKIFATDLDEQSLNVGRRATYPLAAVNAIPERYVERFISKKDDTIEVSKQLRNCLVFARHNISEDPPFPNIDLISCRNTLIYFTQPLQERVVDLFSFALAPGSLLFLGGSESLGRAALGFSVLNPVHRIYARSQGPGRPRSRLTLAMPLQRLAPIQRASNDLNMPRESVPEQHINLIEALVRTLAHPCLVLDENHDLVEVVGDVSAYCRIPEGRLTAAAGALLRAELQPEARTLFLLVRADRRAASSGLLHLPDRELALRLEAAPLQVGERALTVLSFIEQREAPSEAVPGLASSDRDAAFAREIERLERELLSSQDTLRRSMADLEQANEELEASSEELQASSEELQSSNEELEASNEELQATNEELGTLNQQLRIRSDELERLNTDLENIQSSLSQGMVIVDRQLRITRFSPLAVRVFGLVDSDIGQPLIGVPTTVPLPELRDALLAVVHGEERRSIEATSEEVAYLAQVMPYRDREGTRLGAIITLTDVSEMVALRRSAEAALREFASLADALEQAVWKRDHTMERILYMSRRIERLTGWSAAELCHDPQLFDNAIDADDRARVAAARHVPGAGWSVTYRLHRRDGQLSTLQERATVLNDGHDHSIVGTLTDVTEQHRLEQHSRLLAQGFETLIAHGSAPLALVDGLHGCVAVSPSLAAALGAEPAALRGHSLDQLQQGAQAAGIDLASQPLQDNGQVVGVLLLSAPPAPGRG